MTIDSSGAGSFRIPNRHPVVTAIPSSHMNSSLTVVRTAPSIFRISPLARSAPDEFRSFIRSVARERVASGGPLSSLPFTNACPASIMLFHITAGGGLNGEPGDALPVVSIDQPPNPSAAAIAISS